MGRNGSLVVVFIFVLVSDTCSASLIFHLRKLSANERGNASSNSSVSLTGIPSDPLNKVPKSPGKPEEAKQKDSHKGNQITGNNTLPVDSKDATQNSTDRNPSTGKSNVDTIDRSKEKADKHTAPKLETCEGSLRSCRHHEMLACVKKSTNGSSELFLVVQNEGKNNLTVDVSLPNLKIPLTTFVVPKQNTTKKDILSIVGKNTTIVVNSAECVLSWGNPTSVDNLIQQFSFYSKQVTPIYALYGTFLLVLLFGGTWACCKFRKRNREDGVPYQELEMGLPESTTSAANVDTAEGWDHDWDDDDWDEETAVKSPAAHHVRNISVDGLTARAPKKDGWEWED